MKTKNRLYSLLIFSLIVSIFFAAIASAVVIESGTIITSTGLNHTMNLTNNLTVTSLSVQDAYIEFIGLTYNPPSGYEGVMSLYPFNLTSVNVSSHSTDLPLIKTASSTMLTKIITCPKENGTMNISSLLLTTNVPDTSSYESMTVNYSTGDGTYGRNNIAWTTYAGTGISLSGIEVVCPYNTTIYIGNYYEVEKTMTGMIAAVSVIATLMTLIIVVLIMGYVLGAYQRGDIDAKELSNSLIMLVFIGILMGVAFVIFGALSTVF